MEKRVCLGFGETEGNCTNTPGTVYTPFWCKECDDRRRKHIDERFAELMKEK